MYLYHLYRLWRWAQIKQTQLYTDNFCNEEIKLQNY